MKPLLTLLTILSFTFTALGQKTQVDSDFIPHKFDTIIVINKKTFSIHIKDINDTLLSLSAQCNHKTVMNYKIESRALSDMQFLDFNQDGNADIMFTYMGNNAWYSLYLYDTNANSFKEVKNFGDYPDSYPLKANTKYYYSYHRAGCADMDWVSSLFKIQNYTTIEIGYIYGKGCEDESQEIDIYKVPRNNEDKKQLIEKLSYSKYITDNCDKWQFIREYWEKNYKKLIQ